jgi:hypothetical protein
VCRRTDMQSSVPQLNGSFGSGDSWSRTGPKGPPTRRCQGRFLAARSEDLANPGGSEGTMDRGTASFWVRSPPRMTGRLPHPGPEVNAPSGCFNDEFPIG